MITRRSKIPSSAYKVTAFAVITLTLLGVLATLIGNMSFASERTFHADFTDATGVSPGDRVRLSGVEVGRVTGSEIVESGNAHVARLTFQVNDEVPVYRSAELLLRYENIVGQRYLEIREDASATEKMPTEATFPLSQTTPALSLTVLFNGFQPLFRLLDPKDVNTLSAQVIAVFQGEGATVESLLASTASLTSTLAEKDQVIGELITHLESVLSTVNDRSGQLDTTIVTLQRLVSGLAEDSAVIGQTLEGLGDLTGSVADLAEEGRAPLKGSITALGELSENLAADDDVVEDFLQTLPTKLDRIGRLGSYGSWLNTYVCSIEGRIPLPEGYLGDLGAQPVAGRCS